MNNYSFEDTEGVEYTVSLKPMVDTPAEAESATQEMETAMEE
jgi:hypothetical protein